MSLIRRLRNTRFFSQALLGFSLSSFGSAAIGIVWPGGRARALVHFSLTYLFGVLRFLLVWQNQWSFADRYCLVGIHFRFEVFFNQLQSELKGKHKI